MGSVPNPLSAVSPSIFLLCVLYVLCVCAHMYACGRNVEVRGQLDRVGSLLPPCKVPEVELRPLVLVAGAFSYLTGPLWCTTAFLPSSLGSQKTGICHISTIFLS